MFRRFLLAWIVVATLARASLAASPPQKIYLLHLPGIGGHRWIDDMLSTGLRNSGLETTADIYDWTAGNPGLPALVNISQNQQQAKLIAQQLTAVVRANPTERVILTCHSGGAGLAVWTLEDLPDDVKIDTLLFFAPALSPRYDLSKALRHVSGRAYSFNSAADFILGIGTQDFGTIDRVNTPSAGRVGFSIPEHATDVKQYEKLTQFPYEAEWVRYGNLGDHIGALMPRFVEAVVAPLVFQGILPAPTTMPSTMPATMR